MFRAILGTIAILAGGMAEADVLDEIGTRGSIRLGVRADAPPFSYHDAAGAPVGLAVRLCREVVGRIAPDLGLDGLGIEFVTVSATERFPALVDGRTDLHCGPASATLGRREFVDFSLLYYVDAAAAAESPGVFETIFDRKRGVFGVLKGTTTEEVVNDLAARNGITAEIRAYPAHTAGLAALANQKIDVYFGDQAILLFQVEAMGLADQIAVRDEGYSFEPYALVIRRGEDALRLAVDRALSAIYREGVIYEMIRAELGDYELPLEAIAIYDIVALPE